MREGWEVKTLGDVSDFKGGSQPPKSQFISEPREGYIRMLQIRDFKSDARAVYIPNSKKTNACGVDDIMIGRYGASVGQIHRGKAGTYNVALIRTIPNLDMIDRNFFYYFLTSSLFQKPLAEVSVRGAQNGFSKPDIAPFPVPLPPLAEQKRIVALLGEAFAGIAVATAAATKNLKNARELFETTLNTTFTQKGEGWVETTLGEVCYIASKLVDPKEEEYLDLPHLGAGNMISDTGEIVDVKTAREEGLISGKFIFDSDTVLYSKIRPYLKKACRPDFVGLCSADVYPLSVKPEIISKDYLYHLLMSVDFTEYAISGSSRAGMPKVNRNHLFAFRFWVPDISKQQELVSRLDVLMIETQRLEALYQQKLTALGELKQSLLQKAFAGELTAANAIQAVEAMNTLSPEFAANVIAVAFRQHEKVRQGKTYGRVKAQKGLHLIESIGGINLGRAPIKDAAGPNDTDHARSAENWAKANQFFEFVKRPIGLGYDFVKLSKYDALLAQAETNLAKFNDDIRNAIAPLVHKRTETAEVFTTVHAAWNNLIIDGANITDEAIVTEAREGWHPDKMNIDRHKFFEAIQDIRQRGLEPDGTAKRVGGQERLI